MASSLRPADPAAAAAWDVAATVCDPEIPVLSIEDLGVLRRVEVSDAGVQVAITPTYSGCPAMDAIRQDVTAALHGAGYAEVQVALELAPAWTTDWLTADGKAKLDAYGIAPPSGSAAAGPVRVGLSVKCPQCSSLNTRELTRFGSTSCKALWVCRDCLEPFDYFKVL
ncbi:phenylacetate-CoA oxygenase subunit PaaJ [Arthrobacter zhangbolii]|uniref:Phenylacetate-CoA oxygenase subunit PaaJ n=1 Tax=Arthrobacter zhangbolii TaxID=2886936 RepID=A0A9X1M8Z9_9MICC|nr:1,2-phenylacetyl-CoA epoxidase subunit PaaD [Arthrobacter zhangbolii]MCC3272569.1 phenylacetate-CoA oxygenase subunit PaaJ [Arthrobacter zhangbolii]UON91581.1 phenylacetate-CoA oxygenase subunit PaaJ [Arthrobacter zhangbolii]